MKLYGKVWTRREIERHIGRIDQIGGIKHYLEDGDSAMVKLVKKIALGG